jgi:hypothetical protein
MAAALGGLLAATTRSGGGGGGGGGSLWGRVAKAGILLGVARQMGGEFAEMADDPSMLSELMELEAAVGGLWETLLSLQRDEEGDAGKQEDEEAVDGLGFKVYVEMHLRIGKSLDPEFNLGDGQEVCLDDWRTDCGRKMLGDNALEQLIRQARSASLGKDDLRSQRLNKHQFMAAVFELTAVWADRDSMASFARALVGNLGSSGGSSLTGWQFRPLERVRLLSEGAMHGEEVVDHSDDPLSLSFLGGLDVADRHGLMSSLGADLASTPARPVKAIGTRQQLARNQAEPEPEPEPEPAPEKQTQTQMQPQLEQPPELAPEPETETETGQEQGHELSGGAKPALLQSQAQASEPMQPVVQERGASQQPQLESELLPASGAATWHPANEPPESVTQQPQPARPSALASSVTVIPSAALGPQSEEPEVALSRQEKEALEHRAANALASLSMDDVNDRSNSPASRPPRAGTASPVLLKMRARLPRKPRRRPARRDSQWARFNQLGVVAGSHTVSRRPPDGAAVGEEPLHSGRRKVGGFGLPKSPMRERLDDHDATVSSLGSPSSLGGRTKLEAALHRVSHTWLASDDESVGDSSGEDEHNDWQGDRLDAPSWEPLSVQFEQQAKMSVAAAKHEHQLHQKHLEMERERERQRQHEKESEALQNDGDGDNDDRDRVLQDEGTEDAAARAAEGAAWIASATQRRPTSAPPPSSAAWLAKHRQRPSSATVRQDSSVTLIEPSASMSALDAPRRRRRRKPPLPAFKERPTRLVCRPAPAPQRLLPGIAELLGGGWTRVQPFDVKHPCYFWHGRWKRGTWGHPMEPEETAEIEELIAHAKALRLPQEVLRLERVAQLTRFRAGGGQA